MNIFIYECPECKKVVAIDENDFADEFIPCQRVCKKCLVMVSVIVRQYEQLEKHEKEEYDKCH